jgi:hypothetical protein
MKHRLHLLLPLFGLLLLHCAPVMPQRTKMGGAAALGPAHPYTLAARVNLAVCTAEDGDLAAALQPIDQTATQLGIVLGADHPDTLRCEGNLAILSGRLGLAGSDTMMNRALQRLVARLGTSHPAAEAMREGKFLHRIVEPHPF